MGCSNRYCDCRGVLMWTQHPQAPGANATEVNARIDKQATK